MSKAKMGAMVLYCGHKATFIADIHRIGNVNVVRANGPIEKQLIRPTNKQPELHPTHHLVDFPVGGFWRPDLGVFVVPEDQVTTV